MNTSDWTNEEWQDCVNLLAFHLTVQGLRDDGILRGGMVVDVPKAEALLKSAAEKGIVPAPMEELCSKFMK